MTHQIILANGDTKECALAQAGTGGVLYVWMNDPPWGGCDFCLSPEAYLAFRDLRIPWPVTQEEIDRAFDGAA
jgi:hypothetical protein